MKEQNKAQELQKKIARCQRQLSSDKSPIGDWKGIKQRELIDAGKTPPYSAAQMQEYYNAREDVRKQINAYQQEIAELEANGEVG